MEFQTCPNMVNSTIFWYRQCCQDFFQIISYLPISKKRWRTAGLLRDCIKIIGVKRGAEHHVFRHAISISNVSFKLLLFILLLLTTSAQITEDEIKIIIVEWKSIHIASKLQNRSGISNCRNNSYFHNITVFIFVLRALIVTYDNTFTCFDTFLVHL